MSAKSKSFVSAVNQVISGLAFSVALLSALPSQAAPVCRDLFKTDFWSQNRVALSAHTYLTYSFDTELLLGDAMSFVTKHGNPGQIDDANSRLNRMAGPFTIEELADLTEYRPSQFKAFVLKSGTEDAFEYQMSQLRPSALSAVHAKMETKLMKATENFLDGVLLPIANQNGLPLDGEIDGGFIEVKHRSSESSPKTYRDFMKRLHGEFKKPQTHFHIALPSEVISYDEAAEIAHAIEARTVLGLVERASPSSDEDLLYNMTTFMDEFRNFSGSRGVIKLQFDTFSKPFPAHDLEIRQWRNLDDGLKSLEVASGLAERAAQGKLKLRPVPKFAMPEPRYGSVSSSLRYVARILAVSDRALSRRLLAYAKATVVTYSPLEKRFTQRPSDELISEIAKFIKRNDVIAKFDDALLN